MSKILFTITLSILVFSSILMTNCKKDDPDPPVPGFTFTGDNRPAPCEVTFSNSSTNSNSFLWDFGDGTSSTEKNSKHIYIAGGSYNVTLTATGDGGTKSISKNLYVKTQVPVANFSFTGDYYPAPCDVSFTNSSTFGTSFIWEFDDGTSSTQQNVIHTFYYGGTYNVKLTAIGEGGTNSITKQVSVAFQPPVADFLYTGNSSPAPCEVSFVNLSGNASSYLWDFDDGTTSSTENPYHVFYSGGSYNVKLTAYGAGGSNAVYKTVAIQYPSSGTDVTFYNPVYTNIYITMDGSTQAIAPGGEVTFYSVPGSSASYYAYTNGTTTSGTQVGVLIEWDNTISLTGGTAYYNLNVSNDYFFLYIQNDGTHTLTPIYVNYGSWYETVDYVLVPDNGVKYRLGYYRAFTDTEIRGYYQNATSSYTYWYNLNFPWTYNQKLELNNSFKAKSGFDNTQLEGQIPQTLYPAESIPKRLDINKKAVEVKCK